MIWDTTVLSSLSENDVVTHHTGATLGKEPKFFHFGRVWFAPKTEGGSAKW